MKTQPKILVVAMIAAVSLAAGSALAASIGANFVNNNNGGAQDADVDSLNPDESAGASGYTQANWNNLGRWGNSVILSDSLGNSSGVDITWDASGTANLGGTPATPDQKLMYGFTQATGQANDDGPPFNGNTGPNQPDALVHGLNAWLAARGASSYSVVLYVDGDLTDGSVSEHWLQGIATDGSFGGGITLGSDLTPHVFVSDSNNFSGIYSQVPLSAASLETAAAGNFIVFTNLSADMFVLRSEDTYATYAPRSALQIVPEYTIPHIDVQPEQSPAGPIYNGQSFSMAVVAAGSSLNYQWRKDNANLAGQTNPVFSTSNVTTDDSGNYDVVIVNSFGSVTSSPPVMILVNGESAPANAIVSPASVVRGAGGAVTFAVTANGSTPFAYQWIKGSTPLTSQTNATLALTNLGPADAGSYACAVTNFLGGTLSAAGTLAVNAVAGTTLGINFTHGGEVVTTTAFGIPVANWTDLVNASGSQTVGSLTMNWASANTWHLTYPNPGEDEVFYGYLDDGSGGPSVIITGLNSIFGACVVRTLGATDNGVGLQNVTLTNGAQVLTYAVTATSASELKGISSISAPLYDDALKLQGHTGDSGSIRGGLAGIIITDKPVIDRQPQGPTTTVFSGSPFNLTGADAFGVPGLAYQWRKDGSNLPGATYLNYTNSAPTAGDSGNYDLIVTNSFGSVMSSVVVVTVSDAAPFNAVVSPGLAAYSVGGIVDFSVTVDGSLPMTFQWYKDASLLDGQTNSTLVLGNLQPEDAGSYVCAVTNMLGGALSSAGVLTVGAVQPATLGINFTVIGETVTATALGVDPANWANVPGPNNSGTAIGSVTVACSASGLWQEGDFTPAGNNEVFYGYLDDSGFGPSATISGLASLFPAYVVQTLGATDAGSSFQNVTINGSQILSYLAPQTNGTGGLTGQSTQSTTLYGDTVTVQGMAGLSGQARGGLTGVIITDKPVLENQPQAPPGAIYAEGSFSLAGLNVIGVPTLSYQWRKDGTDIPGATDAVYTKSNVTPDDAGDYDVVITNVYGSVTSSVVSISEIVTVPKVTVTQSDNNNLILNWPSGTLLEATNLAGPWTTNDAASPYTVTPTAPQKFFRLLLP